MSSIPPNSNIVGSFFQTQVSASETAKSNDTQRNKDVDDSRRLARSSDRSTSEVEDAEQTEEVIVRRQDDRQRDGQDARDTWEQHRKNEEEEIYQPESQSPEDEQSSMPNEHPPGEGPPSEKNPHIDISA